MRDSKPPTGKVNTPAGQSPMWIHHWAWRLVSTVSAAGWMGIIFHISSSTPVDLPPQVGMFAWLGKWQDVVGHLVLYSVLGSLLLVTLWSWVVASSQQIKWALVAICLGILYGVLDEYHQSFVPGRTATAIDVFVDVLGVTVGVIGSSSCATWVLGAHSSRLKVCPPGLLCGVS